MSHERRDRSSDAAFGRRAMAAAASGRAARDRFRARPVCCAADGERLCSIRPVSRPAALGATIGLAAPLIAPRSRRRRRSSAAAAASTSRSGRSWGSSTRSIVQTLIDRRRACLALAGGSGGAGRRRALRARSMDSSRPFVRIQPIVATLGTYLIFTGLTLTIVPAPIGTVAALD